MTPDELEFLAGETSIDIVPSARIDKLALIKDEYGPFRPQIRTSVPLWLACALRSAGQCRIVAPEWLSLVALESVLQAERDKGDEFAAGLHPSYVEILKLLLQCPGVDQDLQPGLLDIQRLVQAIREIRQQKILHGMQTLDGVPLFLRNVGNMEVNQAKTVLLPAMDKLVRLQRAAREEEKLALASSSARHPTQQSFYSQNSGLKQASKQINQ